MARLLYTTYHDPTNQVIIAISHSSVSGSIGGSTVSQPHAHQSAMPFVAVCHSVLRRVQAALRVEALPRQVLHMAFSDTAQFLFSAIQKCRCDTPRKLRELALVEAEACRMAQANRTRLALTSSH